MFIVYKNTKLVCVWPPLAKIMYIIGGIHVGWVINWMNTKINPPGPRLNIKTVLSTYGDFHVKDKTAVRTSYL